MKITILKHSPGDHGWFEAIHHGTGRREPRQRGTRKGHLEMGIPGGLWMEYSWESSWDISSTKIELHRIALHIYIYIGIMFVYDYM